MVKKNRKTRVLARFDASALIGLPVMVLDATEEIDEGNAEGPDIAIPRIEDLSAAAAVARCQLAPRLRGGEVRTLRGLLDMMQADLAAALGNSIVVETISRWEKEKKNVNEAVEKLLRLLVCERLRGHAPGISYDPVALIGLRLSERPRKMAPMEFCRTRTKVGRSIDEAWTVVGTAEAKAAA